MTADASEPRNAGSPLARIPHRRLAAAIPGGILAGGVAPPSPGSVSAWPFQSYRAGAFPTGASSMVDSKAAPASVLPLNGSLTTGTC